MIFHKFKIHAFPHISEAYCECGHELEEVSNGLLSEALFCSKCENVYLLKLVKIPKSKITKEFLEQSRFEIKLIEEKSNLTKKLREEFDEKRRNRGKH